MTGLDDLLAAAEADYCAWRLKQLYSDVSGRSAIDALVDEATGREQALRDEADTLMARFRELTGGVS